MYRIAQLSPQQVSLATAAAPWSRLGAVFNRRTLVLWTSILASSLIFINRSAVFVALPWIQSAFEGSVMEMQWISNGYLILFASLLLLGGGLTDRFGPRQICRLGVILFALASASATFADGSVWLALSRSLQGAGAALIAPASLALLNTEISPSRRKWAIGVWSCCATLASAIGPLGAGRLLEVASWRWVFGANLPIAGVILCLLCLCPEQGGRQKAQAPLDLVGAALITAALALLTLGGLRAASHGIGDLITIEGLLGGLGLMGLFARWEKRQSNPLIPPALFRDRSFRGVNALAFCLYAGYGGLLFLLPFYLIQVQEMPAAQAGAAFLPVIVLIALLSRWANRWADCFGTGRLLASGSVIVAAGLFSCAWIAPQQPFWIGLLPGLLLVGTGLGLSIAPLTTAVLQAAPAQSSGAAAGINNAVCRAASLTAIIVCGGLLAWGFDTTLKDGLSSLALPEAVQSQILSHSGQLLLLPLPEGLSSIENMHMKRLLEQAILSGYRLAMGAAGLLALLGGGISAVCFGWGSELSPKFEKNGE